MKEDKSPGEWAEYEFADLCDITRGASPRPIHDWVSNDGIPWLKIADASATKSRYIMQTKERIRYEGITKSVSVFPGDLILSNSATPGIPKIVGIEACIHDGWLLLRNLRNLDKLFCYYLLLFERPRIVEQGSGTVFTNLKTDILKRHRVKTPPLPEQRAIAHILGTLDDKIELNLRMNTTLEEMTQGLFKSWFVDFEPVRAKMEGLWRRGESLPGLPAGLYDMFPNRLVPSEIGEVPEGWAVKALGEIIELAYGKSLRADKRLDGHIPVYGSNGQVGWHNEKLVDGPGVIVGRKGNPGIVAWSQVDFYPIDTTFYVKSKDAGTGFFFLHYALKGQNLPSVAADSAVPGLNRNLAYMNRQLVPRAEIVSVFDLQVETLFSQIHCLEEENRTLADLRDALLPRLMSGNMKSQTLT